MSTIQKIKILKIVAKLQSVATIFICFWIITSPYIPELTYSSRSLLNTFKKSKIVASGNQNIEKSKQENEIILNLKENEIYIPRINLVTSFDEKIKDISELHNGGWLRPNGNNPSTGGNTVIIAHRYTRKNGLNSPNTFYHLPKVESGDLIYLRYGNKFYKYKASEIKTVEPTEVSIEDATTTVNILTLYTCTPIWTSTNRHVVVSSLVDIQDINLNPK
jgi:LPXTG-site transpeptidase (sortase) family protein